MNITKDIALQLLTKELNFIEPPPSIMDFVHDDYYLGQFYKKSNGQSKIYSFWLDHLQAVFPNNITTKSFISVNGAIGCLTGDTQISMMDGPKTIKDLYDEKLNLHSPSKSLSFNTESMKPEFDRVIDVFYSGYAPTYKIMLNDSTSFKCTSNHPFLDIHNNWVSIDNGMTVGTVLKNGYYGRSPKSVVGINSIGSMHVYDLTTESTHNFVLDNGIIAHNTGKSTFSTIVMLYDYCKLLCMHSPGEYLELINLTGLWLYFMSVFNYKAAEFIAPVVRMMKTSPFFIDMKKKNDQWNNIKLRAGSKPDNIISIDLVSCILSEINFIKHPDKLLNTVISRLTNRMQKGTDILNHIILDSSDTNINSPTERFVRDSPYSNRIYRITAPIWKVKYWMYSKETFKVYAGDSVVSPHIVKDGEDTSEYEESRLLDVPVDLKPNFENDLELALKDQAGLGTISGGLLFPDDRIKNRFILPQTISDVLVVDFYDATEIYDLDGVVELVESLPDDRSVYVGLDCGYASDKYGIAIGYASSLSMKLINEDTEERSMDLYIKVPIAFSLSRKRGQETNISKVRNFLLYVNSIRHINCVIYDGFQSVQLSQEMRAAGINAKYLSVEKDKYYIIFKHLLNEGKVDIVDNKLLYRELRCLRHIKGIVNHSNYEGGSDHTKQSTGVNSKDISDALVRLVAKIYMDGKKALDVPLENTEYHADYMLSALKSLEKLQLERSIRSRYPQSTFNPYKVR